MTVVQAARTSYEEYILLAEGKQQQEREDWERRRWEVFMQWTISPNLKNRPKVPQDVMRFPWEKEVHAVENVEPLSEAELSSLCEIFKLNREDVINGQDK